MFKYVDKKRRVAEFLKAESVQPTQGFETQDALVADLRRVDTEPQTRIVWILECVIGRNVRIVVEEEECESKDVIKLARKDCACFKQIFVSTRLFLQLTKLPGASECAEALIDCPPLVSVCSSTITYFSLTLLNN